ncbi:MAG: methionine ABC transporter ATP-binding protein [Erysipelotrichaceae bacterium]|nr:methionine ABC transporter ATP-binding protein [Erysipelotrichaceae bacterium]
MIKISNLTKKYNNDVVALNGVTLSVDKGDIYGIIGLSGAGKSTLVRCINLLEQPTSGTIEIDGVDLTKLSKKDLRVKRKEISMIFQNFNLLQQKNVLQNVLFPLQISNNDKQYSLEKAKDLLKMVDLSDKLDSYPSQLSGGQKQRVAIARALASDPKVLLCDEPTSALDPQTTASILQLLKTINQKLNITIIMITHQMSVVEKICNKVAILSEGKVAESGQVNEVFSNPKSLAAKKLVFPEGFDDILSISSSKKMIRIVFDGQKVTEKPIIAMMSQQTGVLASISYASTKSIGGKLYGSMILTVDDSSQLTKVLDYLNSNGLIAREVNLQD